MGRILDVPGLLAARESARAEGRRVVQCHGCFDIVHPGHVRHLRFAKAQGDLLLVTITGDEHIGKGVGRPLIPEELRAENLAALDFVDWVCIDQRPTAGVLLGEVRPDVYVKGREYETNNDPRFREERETVERGGGRVVFSSGDVVFSSTALIRAMEQSVHPFHHRLAALHDREELSGDRLFSTISSFRDRRIVVVGETILDTYVFCDRPSVGGESPVMTLRPLERRYFDGGAAIIARHAAALGAKPVLVTTLPTEGEAGERADRMRERLTAEGVEVRAVRQEAPVAEKQRYLVGTQKMMKIDLVEPIALDAARQDELIGVAEEAAMSADGAIVADFGLGLLSSGMLRRVCAALRPRVGVLAGDVSGRRSGLRDMRSVDLVCPTESELREAYQTHDEGLPVAVWRMMRETKARSAIVTMGGEGVVAFEPLPGADEPETPGEGWRARVRGEHVPAMSAHPVDALGCGDALITVATLARAGGGSVLASAYLGSIAAAIQGQRVGNIPVGATDLRHELARVRSSHLAFASQEVIESRAPAGAPAA